MRAPEPPAASDAAALAAWHGGWAAATGLVALADAWLGLGLEGPTGAANLAMALPGVAGLLLLWRDEPRGRDLLLAAWVVAAVLAAVLSGGTSGALPGFVIAPLAAGVALGGVRRAQVGAAASGLAALAGVAASLFGGAPAPHPLLAALSVIVAATAAAFAFGLSWRDRERRAAAAEAARGRAETLLAGQPGLTLVLEPAGRVLAAYGAPPPGLPVDPLFAAGLVAAVHAPDRPALLAVIDRALLGHEAQTVLTPRIALDRRIVLAVRRLDAADAAPPRLVAHAFDGTAQHARELGLEAARAEAEARDAGKTRFLALMSHELRTPLNAVLGFADIMRQRLFGPLPDRYADYAGSIHAAGVHLLDLINDVLDVAKIEAERYELSIERFDVREAVSAAIALIRIQADDKGVTLAGVLPPEPLTVAADRRALKQIALNLLSNAVKFTPAGGSVTVSVSAIGPYLELVVADTGVGISPDDVRRLGRPFEQAGHADQRAQGTGLGLSLVRSLAELHGGRMSVDSTLGEGTAVTVRMPIVSAAGGGAEIIPLGASRAPVDAAEA